MLRDRNRQTDRQRDWGKDRQTDRQAGRQADRQTETERGRETKRGRVVKTEWDSEGEREREGVEYLAKIAGLNIVSHARKNCQ